MNYMGAEGAIPRSDNKRMDAHAEQYYEEIRKRTSDVAAIAKNTGFSIVDIEKIKRHIFINTHDLGEEEPSRFDPDYDMAVSWQRLESGKGIKEMDIVLLNHELYESNLMANGVSYKKAHEMTEVLYSYSKYINEIDMSE